jgi:hypothetical protein
MFWIVGSWKEELRLEICTLNMKEPNLKWIPVSELRGEEALKQISEIWPFGNSG